MVDDLGKYAGTVSFDRYGSSQQAVPVPEPEPQEPRMCGEGREPALRNGTDLLCLLPGTFEVLAERGWDLTRP